MKSVNTKSVYVPDMASQRDRRRQERGYQHKVLRTTDKVVKKPVRRKTQVNYDRMLDEWDQFVLQQKGPVDVHDIKTLKDFLLFHTLGRNGRLDVAGRMSQDSVYANWKSFMAGWQRRYNETFSSTTRSTVESFIRGGEDGLLDLTVERRPVRNLTLQDFHACARQLWQNDWHDYRHERYRVGLHLLLLLHTCTSARCGEYETQLRYQDTAIYQVWLKGRPQIVLDLHRRNVKGMADLPREQPEHLIYELVGQPFFYNTVAFFVAKALADDVLQDYQTWDQICAIPEPAEQKHKLLKFKEEARSRPVFPRCDGRGPKDNITTSSSLAHHALVELGRRTGFRDNLTIHAFRREALLKVDQHGYSINERMRFAAHRDPHTYAAHYQTRISTVDGQVTYLGLQQHVSELPELQELFRGYSINRHHDYRPRLPHHLQVELEDNAAAMDKIHSGADDGDDQGEHQDDEQGTQREQADVLDNKVLSTGKPADLAALERQSVYDQKRRRKDRLQREHLRSHPDYDSASLTILPHESDFQQIRKLAPERDQLARLLFQSGSLRDKQGRQVMQSLVSICRTDITQAHCASLNDSSDHCTACHHQKPPRNQHMWWAHLYSCHKSAAKAEGRDSEFCFLCFQWIYGADAWNQHVDEHLSAMPLKCNFATFRGNVLRPGLCPACLGDAQSPARRRFRQFTNVTKWKAHLVQHLGVASQRSFCCPHPRCTKFPPRSQTEYLHHLSDVHEIRLEGKTCIAPLAGKDVKTSRAASTYAQAITTQSWQPRQSLKFMEYKPNRGRQASTGPPGPSLLEDGGMLGSPSTRDNYDASALREHNSAGVSTTQQDTTSVLLTRDWKTSTCEQADTERLSLHPEGFNRPWLNLGPASPSVPGFTGVDVVDCPTQIPSINGLQKPGDESKARSDIQQSQRYIPPSDNFEIVLPPVPTGWEDAVVIVSESSLHASEVTLRNEWSLPQIPQHLRPQKQIVNDTNSFLSQDWHTPDDTCQSPLKERPEQSDTQLVHSSRRRGRPPGRKNNATIIRERRRKRNAV